MLATAIIRSLEELVPLPEDGMLLGYRYILRESRETTIL
jgi:hypothetical protein